MRLFIVPTEPLLFRTGHPFNAGESSSAETLFPPTPETLQGALRSTIATHWRPDSTLAAAFADPALVDTIGDTTHYGRLSIQGISLARRLKEQPTHSAVERLFPPPTHLQQSTEPPYTTTLLRPFSKEQQDAEGITANLPATLHLLYPPSGQTTKLEAVHGWLTAEQLRSVLHADADLSTLQFIQHDEIYTLESRLGIGVHQQRKTTEEGRLYQVSLVRMNHHTTSPYLYGFALDVRLFATTALQRLLDDEQTQALLRLPDQGWMILGGERRAARFEVFSSVEEKNTVQPGQVGNLLYFATPASFVRGWRPELWPSPLANVRSVAIERLQPIGGWKLHPGSAGGEHKMIRRCVPAGSVYFFDRSFPVPLSLTDYGQQIGYGIVYAGEYEP